MAFNIPTSPQEKLFLNTLAFQFPKKPVVFYFSLENVAGISSVRLNHQLFPDNIRELFPNISYADYLYTTFTRECAGFSSLAIDFNIPQNYYLVKRYYNRELKYFFQNKYNLLVEETFIHDNRIWVLSNDDNPREDCNQFNHFTIRIDYDHFNHQPQIVLTADRPSKVLKKSVAELLNMNDDPFSTDNSFDTTMVKRAILEIPHENYTFRIIDRYEYLTKHKKFDSARTYPVVNSRIDDFIDDDNDDTVVVSRKRTNRYSRYLDRIQKFYNNYLNNDDFRRIIPIENGFSCVNPLQIGHTPSSSKELRFGQNTVNFNPQKGINDGPYESAPYDNIQLLSIFPEEDKDAARNLLTYFRDGYKDFFKGLKKYTGKDFAFSKHYLPFKNRENPIDEITIWIDNLSRENKLDINVRYVAIYLTPISKNTSNRDARKIYFQVKNKLLQYQIVSQCIETEKMLSVLDDDNTKTDRYGNHLKNFAYTLQNMSIAICAKLGGTPWRINTEKQNELVVGIGAYRNLETNTQYIGSAFSFDNTGAFNSFVYFQKDELKELAGSIQDAIINFARLNGKPDKLIIHYYKEWSLNKEEPLIEKCLQNLGLQNMPVYVVTVYKTESEDVVLFDKGNQDLMPYSGRYVNLGNKEFLLCNNTRYENCQFNPYLDSLPFPVKLRIECPTSDTDEIDTTTIQKLIDQVYQFSRIYWKSVKQQNLPVTIKYPEMIAQMMPYFDNTTINSIDTNHLWFL